MSDLRLIKIINKLSTNSIFFRDILGILPDDLVDLEDPNCIIHKCINDRSCKQFSCL
jgi:hypothetical protein